MHSPLSYPLVNNKVTHDFSNKLAICFLLTDAKYPMVGDVHIVVHSESDDDLQQDGTTTGASNGEPTGNTTGSNEDNWNEHRHNAHSTTQPPTTEMGFDSFESAKEHYMAYA
jgi:hypothetical protein